MTPAAAPPRGAVGRADLLRALAVAPRTRLTLDQSGEEWFGYAYRHEELPLASRPKTLIRSDRPAPPPQPGETRLPLRLPLQHVIAERQPREQPQDAEPTAVETTPAAPLDEEAAKAPSPVRLIDYEDLVPQARLIPALRHLLSTTRAGSLDVERLTRQIAGNELPRHLPRRRFRRWHPDLILVLDFCPRLWPYREDMHRLAERLLRFCGRSGVALRVINHGPWGTWSNWVDHQNPRLAGLPVQRPWSMPAAGTPVLLVSDLGLLTGPQSPASQAWRGFVRALKRSQARPFALAPLGASQIDADLAQVLPILRWSPDAPAHPVRTHGPARPDPAGLETLLALVAALRRVDPPLLRALRKLTPARLDAGLEGALWCHPDVEAGSYASLRSEPGIAEPHLARFARLLPQLQAKLNALRTRHHAHLRAVVNHEEMLVWATHAAEAGEPIADATDFFRRLARTLAQPAGSVPAEPWWSVAQGIVRRADTVMGRRQSELLTPLAAALLRRDLMAGTQEPKVPPWADPQRLSAALQTDATFLRCWLVRDAASGYLLLQATPPGPRQSPLGEPLLLDAGGARVTKSSPGSPTPRWLFLHRLPATLQRLTEPGYLEIQTSRETLIITSITRPLGAAGWGCDERGLTVRSAPLAGYEAHWGEPALRITAVPGGPRPWLLEAEAVGPAQEGAQWLFGIDAPHGVYAEFTLKTRHGVATQRLRWIEPGSFLMGSPEEEPDRERLEGPQHLVTLTEGFWLADTACTQALWRAVMGDNPSYFTVDVQQPVEQVSWYDVQSFLRKLEGLLLGCAATLPTEAQWEYACRGGTTTAFSFGDQISPELLNCNGELPYAGRIEGHWKQWRQETVRVNGPRPNPWGLYGMHGNPWEWCADGLRTYIASPQRDPAGQLDPTDGEALRCVRGGSWGDDARLARSADRYADRPGVSSTVIGFRFCLRPIRPGQDSDLSGGMRGRTEGGEPEGPAAALMQRARQWIDDLRPDRKRKV